MLINKDVVVTLKSENAIRFIKNHKRKSNQNKELTKIANKFRKLRKKNRNIAVLNCEW